MTSFKKLSTGFRSLLASITAMSHITLVSAALSPTFCESQTMNLERRDSLERPDDFDKPQSRTPRTGPSPNVENIRQVVLAPGTDSRIQVHRNQNISIGSLRSVKIYEERGAIRLIGKKLGQTHLRLGANVIPVFVIEKKQFEFYERLKDLFEHLKGLTISIDSNIEDTFEPDSKKLNERFVIVISGELLRLQDWQGIQKLWRPGDHYSFRAEFSDLLADDPTLFLNDWLKFQDLGAPSWQPKPWLKAGLVGEQKNHFKRYQQALEPFGLGVNLAVDKLNLGSMIRTKIIVAEVQRNFFRKYGLKWPDGYTMQPFVSPAESLAPTTPFLLQALEQQGYGKVLASPNLLCRSGKEAQFQAGGEFPIRVMNFKVQHVVWKRYGILLKVKPLADQKKQMSLSLETEISDINSSQMIDGLPSLNVNRLESHVDLSRSATIALSGLIKRNTGQSSEGLPWLQQIPVLGALFSSRDFHDHKTELVIFVTPEIIDL